MSEYNFKKIEEDWQQYWRENSMYKVNEDTTKPKYFVLDMFPYPSGAGLHVGHPLGYIASDIYARYKRLKGFNVLHPMGYDSFGLPAEQYAIQTGQHPAITTETNINRYREQLDKIGFSFDWSREVRTSDPKFYKWTQWIFIQLFNSWYNTETDKSEPIETLIAKFEKGEIPAPPDGFPKQSTDTWNNLGEKVQQEILMLYRNAYLSETYVNWCPSLGTVLANDEVKDGVSERGGHPVERKLMMQWSMRISAYAERLLNDLQQLDWPEPLKDSQTNWIGKSKGSSLKFELETAIDGEDEKHIEVFTTRPDTVFGVSFLTLAPEHDWAEKLATDEHKDAVKEYIYYAKNRSERERQAEVKNITGQFTGSYIIHPFTGKQIPIWIGDYVLAGYGTGAVMGVPAHDSRDHAFATHFGLDIIQVITAPEGHDIIKESYDAKLGKCINSDFLNGFDVKDSIIKAIEEIEKRGLGKGKINYRLRDAIFGRQRYWGEPIPIYYKDGIPYVLDEKELPLILPEVDKYLPTESGEPPLARAAGWQYETTTMPGWAGSSWYMFRYMDPHNTGEFASKESMKYWQQVDLYIGGSEHATGHLLYVRFWTKFLYDMGFVPVNEPAKKLINQGMIQGWSSLAYRLKIKYKINWKLPDDETINYLNHTDTIFIPIVMISKYKLDAIIKGNISKEELLKIEELVAGRIKDYYSSFSNSTITDLEFDFSNCQELNFSIIYTEEIPNDASVSKLDIGASTEWFKQFQNATNIDFITEDDGTFLCSREIEKMSKSKWNVVNPDDIITQYGADTLRLYEMFLGPIEQSKPWNTQGIEGVHRFLKKLWGLFYNRDGNYIVSDEAPNNAELKVLHKAIKKAGEDVEGFSFNTSVSAFMICVNDLIELDCHKKNILEQLLIILSPYAPHICEELWSKLGNTESITKASWPMFNPEYLVENSFNYPVSVNGKLRLTLELALDMAQADVEKAVLQHEVVQKWIEGKEPKKIVFVKGKIVNVVV